MKYAPGAVVPVLHANGEPVDDWRVADRHGALPDDIPGGMQYGAPLDDPLEVEVARLVMDTRGTEDAPQGLPHARALVERRVIDAASPAELDAAQLLLNQQDAALNDHRQRAVQFRRAGEPFTDAAPEPMSLAGALLRLKTAGKRK